MYVTPSERLVKFGFINPKFKKFYVYDKKKEYWVPKDKSKGYIADHADEEFHEQATVMPGLHYKTNTYTASGYPDTIKKYRLIYKSDSASIEEAYYWIMDHFKVDQGVPEFEKIQDIFTASEQSAFWGQAQQRLSIQQERASQYMATIGKMLKDLFQLVRELRILEERLDIYRKAPDSKSADVTLKGLYIDLVEGGAKNPSSVYGISQQVGFTILPDLFFNTHIYDTNRVDAIVENMKWNLQVKNVLKRKLFAFLNWRVRTQEELKSRYKFTLRYLRQHWGIIKMYMTWIKPYLRNVQRLRMHEHQREDYRIISAFETSVTDIEVVAKKPVLKKGLMPCVLVSMRYTTSPEMSYHQEGYAHKGPLHVGEIEFHFRAYAWTQKDIDRFRRMRDDEEMELIKLIDESVAAAMDALGDELYKYLREAEEKLLLYGIDDELKDGKKSRAPDSVTSLLDPFLSIFGGFGELFGNFGIKKKEKKGPKITEKDRFSVAESIMVDMYFTYKNYKKGHQMVHW